MSSSIRSIFMPLLVCVLVVETATAVVPPPQAWSYTRPSILPATGNAEDWIFGITQTSDGGYVAGGYTDVSTGGGNRRHGVLMKLDANRVLLWEKEIYPITQIGRSFVWDVVETATAYVASGNVQPDNGESSLMIVRVSKNDPSAAQVVTFTPDQLGLGGHNINGYSLRGVADAAGEHGFIIGATARLPNIGPDVGFILRLDNDLDPMPFGGNANGVVRVQPPGPPTPRTYCKKVRVTRDSAGNVAKFVAVGDIPSVTVTGGRDSFIATYSLNGNLLASRTMNRNDLEAVGPYVETPVQSLCDNVVLNTTSTTAFDVVELPGGDLVAAIQISRAAKSDTKDCTNARLNGFSYVEMNVVLVRMSGALAPRWAKDIGRFSGIDFETPMVLMNDGFAVAGTDATNSNAVVFARVIKADFNGDVQWTGDYLIPGDLNDCVFAMTKTFEEGLVVAGNNDLNGEDYFALKIAPLPDIWMKDQPADTGDEATPQDGVLWASEDVWVRQKQDFYPFPGQHDHQNPEYRDPALSLPNYVYAEVRNRGSFPASGRVKFYFAKASTGLAWPIDWQASTLCCGAPCGGSLPAVQVVNLAPGATQVVQAEWYPPNPASFAGGQCGPIEEQGHFCLLARIETASGAPWGMTVPETPSVGRNTAANNNIVWKNVTVVDNIAGAGKKAFGFIRNPATVPAGISLTFTAPATDAGTLFDYAEVELTLSPELMRSWRAGGNLGTGIQQINDSTVRLLRPGAAIQGINMQGRQMERYSVRLVPRAGMRGRQPAAMSLDVTQSAQSASVSGVVGGMRFTLEAPESVSKRRAVRH
jgi:hypothetical protein